MVDLDFITCLNVELPKEARKQAFFRYEVTCWANAIERGLPLVDFERDLHHAIQRELDSRKNTGFSPTYPFTAGWASQVPPPGPESSPHLEGNI